MLADPPIYLPWIILTACVIVLAWSFWPAKQVEPSLDPPEPGGRSIGTTTGPTNMGDGPMHIGDNVYNHLPVEQVVEGPSAIRVDTGSTISMAGGNFENLSGFENIVKATNGSAIHWSQPITMRNITTTGQTGGINNTGDHVTIVSNDPSLRGRIRALFDSVDIIIMTKADITGELEFETRMFEHQYAALEKLMSEDAEHQYVREVRPLSRHPQSTFWNGTMGPMGSGDQIKVAVTFGEKIRDRS